MWTEVLIANGLPFSLSNDPLMRRLFSSLLPSDISVAPDRRNVSEKYVPRLYEKVKAYQLEMLERNQCEVSFDTDLWMSPANIHYIAFIVFWLDVDLKPQTLTLRMMPFPDVAHTGQAIMGELRNLIFDFKLNAICIARDHAANMTSATTILEELQNIAGVGCSAHHYQLMAKNFFFPKTTGNSTTHLVELGTVGVAVPEKFAESVLAAENERRKSTREKQPTEKGALLQKGSGPKPTEEDIVNAAWARAIPNIEDAYRAKSKSVLSESMGLIKAFTSNCAQRLGSLRKTIAEMKEENPGMSLPEPYMPIELRFLDVIGALENLYVCREAIRKVLLNEIDGAMNGPRVDPVLHHEAGNDVNDFFGEVRRSRAPPPAALQYPLPEFWENLDIILRAFSPINALVKSLQSSSINLHFTFIYILELHAHCSKASTNDYEVAVKAHILQLLKYRENTRTAFESAALKIAPLFIPGCGFMCDFEMLFNDFPDLSSALIRDEDSIMAVLRELRFPDAVAPVAAAAVDVPLKRNGFGLMSLPNSKTNSDLKQQLSAWVIECSQDSSMAVESLGKYKDPEALLDFWRKDLKYPLLKRAFKYIFTIRPASVNSERLFSSAGFIVGDKRTALAPEQVEKLTIIRSELVKDGRHFSFVPDCGQRLEKGSKLNLG